MTDQKTILLKVDGTDYFLETNINLTKNPMEYYCQVWHHPDVQKFAEQLHWTRGEFCITDAVLWLNDHLQDLIAHKIRRVK